MSANKQEARWRDQAACTSIGIDVMYATSAQGVAIAKAQCFGCPVRAECLAYALDQNEVFGVWGGTDPEERKQLREENEDGDPI